MAFIPVKSNYYPRNFSKVATSNVFYFYGDLVPQGKDNQPKGKVVLSSSWMCISDLNEKVHDLPTKTQHENRLLSLNWGTEYRITKKP